MQERMAAQKEKEKEKRKRLVEETFKVKVCIDTLMKVRGALCRYGGGACSKW